MLIPARNFACKDNTFLGDMQVVEYKSFNQSTKRSKNFCVYQKNVVPLQAVRINTP